MGSYTAELAERGRRAHTVSGYRSDLSGFVDHLEHRGGGLDRDAVISYSDSLAGLAPATQARKRAALRGFVRWAATHGLAPDRLDDDLAGSAPRRPPAPPAPAGPTPVDVEAALAQIPRAADRDNLLFGLLSRLGLRPGEALALSIDDFDEREGVLEVAGWGGKRRRVLVDDPDLLMRLANWPLANGRTTGPLFCAPGRSTPLRYQSVAERWSRYAAAAAVSVGLGDLRRFHAGRLLAGGVPEWVVRDRLGQRTGPLTGSRPDPAAADDVIRAWQAGRESVARRETSTPARRRRGAG